MSKFFALAFTALATLSTAQAASPDVTLVCYDSRDYGIAVIFKEIPARGTGVIHVGAKDKKTGNFVAALSVAAEYTVLNLESFQNQVTLTSEAGDRASLTYFYQSGEGSGSFTFSTGGGYPQLKCHKLGH